MEVLPVAGEGLLSRSSLWIHGINANTSQFFVIACIPARPTTSVLPTIFAGINQTIMMALAMVVIASMIGVKGLGLPVLRAVSNQYLALGLMNGLAIVVLAIIFDRVTQKFGLRMQKYRKEIKD